MYLDVLRRVAKKHISILNDVLASHTCAGDLNVIKHSTASLSQNENRNLPFNIVVERIQRKVYRNILE